MAAFDPDRFLTAQAHMFETALRELQAGRKRTHWMWFIFPQLRSLGRSSTALYYGIADLAEARAYLEHPLLRERLVSAASALLSLEESDPRRVMGFPDDLKLCSSMTLFEAADPAVPEFGAVLDKFFGGVRDPETLRQL